MKRSEFLKLTASGLVGSAFARFPKMKPGTTSDVTIYFEGTWTDNDETIYDLEVNFERSSITLGYNHQPINVLIKKRDKPYQVHNEKGEPQFYTDGSPEMKTEYLFVHRHRYHVESTKYIDTDEYLVTLKEYLKSVADLSNEALYGHTDADKPKLDEDHYFLKHFLTASFLYVKMNEVVEFRKDSETESGAKVFYQRTYDPNAATGCYLTSSCTFTRGLPDDCYELQTLRDFRDNYMAHLPEGKAMIKDYYQHAKPVLDTIAKQENPMEFQDFIYEHLVSPSIDLIENGQQELAMHYYHQFVLELQNRLCIPN